MDMTADELRSRLLELPRAKRAELALELITSLDEGADADAEPAWLDEVERRLRDIDAGTATLEEWSAVRDRIRSRLRSP
jgi:putative addiction module component (TIGR02574 family)